MAKRILVNEGSNIKTIPNVAKLVTRLQNGNMCTWVPEDELMLATKTIVKDGTYKAASEAGSPYGYSQVTVNGVGTKIMGELSEKSITKNGTYRASEDKDGPFYGYSKIYVGVSGGGGGGGGGEPSTPITGKDDDDDDAMAEVDDDGNVVITKLPDTIQVITPPTITVYEDGQTIDFHGIEVKAYLPDGTEWGTVDNLELSFPEPIAEFDPDTYVDITTGTATSDLINGSIIYGVGTMVKQMPSGSKTVYEGQMSMAVFTDDMKPRERADVVLASSSSPICVSYSIWADGSGPHDRGTITGLPYRYNGKTVYWSGSDQPYYGYAGEWPLTINPQRPSYGVGSEKLAWTMIYGTLNETPAGSTQTIPVQWHRPGDKKSLYGSFTITVNKPDDSGSQDPEPAPTPSPD